MPTVTRFLGPGALKFDENLIYTFISVLPYGILMYDIKLYIAFLRKE